MGFTLARSKTLFAGGLPAQPVSAPAMLQPAQRPFESGLDHLPSRRSLLRLEGVAQPP
ncbi:hypothetical protein SALBM311S_06947 [Streptomyces alboniger]